MNTTNKTAVEERVWVFVAYSNGTPYFSKLFTDHTEMKLFSAEHSEKTEGYSSDYFDLTDKSLLTQAHQQGEKVGEERMKRAKDQTHEYYRLRGEMEGVERCVTSVIIRMAKIFK